MTRTLEAALSSRAPHFVPSPTVEQFILTVAEGPRGEMRFVVLEGPRGEGKTTGGLMACTALAERVCNDFGGPLPIRVGVVRDTWQNLSRTTLVSFHEARQLGVPIEVFDGGLQAAIRRGNGEELVHFDFFGLDRREDADKLQGFACAVLWLEEVAPAAGLATGIPAEVLGLGATSVRQSGVPPRILVTMNPPDEDHWIGTIEQELSQRGLDGMRVVRLHIPPGEKSAHFERMAATTEGDDARRWQLAAEEFDAYRARNLAFLESIGRSDLVKRLVKGERGMVVLGEAVVPNFSRLLHVAKEPLPVYPQLPMHRWWDSGTPSLHPAIAWVQVGPNWINVLGSRTGENVGILEFIQDEVLPFQQKYGIRTPTAAWGAGRDRMVAHGTLTVEGEDIAYDATEQRRNLPRGQMGRGAQRGFKFRDIGDPACLIPEGTSSQRTVALAIENALGTSFEPGPVAWSARREALLAAFSRKGLGDRMLVQIDPTENDLMIKGLAGRFHYGKDLATGRIIGTIENAKKNSGIYSHAIDCLGYGLGVLFPAGEWLQQRSRTTAPSTPARAPRSWIGT